MEGINFVKEVFKKYWKMTLAILAAAVLSFFVFVLKDNIFYLFELLKNPDVLSSYLRSFGHSSWIIFIMLQVTQVVIFFIPGEFIQAGGGFLFGTLVGTAYSMIGISIGNAILFLLTKKYGHKLVERIVPQKVKGTFEKILNSKNINLIVFLIYLLPGLPKDTSSFLCGLSKVSFKNFILFSALGRLPALFVSSYFGANIASGKIWTVIPMAIISVTIGGLCMMFRGHLFSRLEKIN